MSLISLIAIIDKLKILTKRIYGTVNVIFMVENSIQIKIGRNNRADQSAKKHYKCV